LVAIAVVALAACSAQTADPRADYRDHYPIIVKTETMTTAVPIAPDETVDAASQRNDLVGFVRDFANRARSPMFVETARIADDDALTQARAEHVRRLLIGLGLRPDELMMQTRQTRPGTETTVLLTFVAGKVEVPPCGDFSASPTFNPSNLPDSNYGCATQRNLGMMAADPNDLVRAKASLGYDAERTTDVITKHRTGKITETEKSPFQRGSYSIGSQSATQQ
jgi:pilus assembly protein CpaD